MQTVYRFTILWASGETDWRYVCAETEEQAIKKMEQYRTDAIENKHMMDFTIYRDPTVEIDYVIA